MLNSKNGERIVKAVLVAVSKSQLLTTNQTKSWTHVDPIFLYCV